MKNEQQFQAESDAHTLAHAESIKSDKTRLAKAKIAAKKMAEEKMKELNNMRKISRTPIKVTRKK